MRGRWRRTLVEDLRSMTISLGIESWQRVPRVVYCRLGRNGRSLCSLGSRIGGSSGGYPETVYESLLLRPNVLGVIVGENLMSTGYCRVSGHFVPFSSSWCSLCRSCSSPTGNRSLTPGSTLLHFLPNLLLLGRLFWEDTGSLVYDIRSRTAQTDVSRLDFSTTSDNKKLHG